MDYTFNWGVLFEPPYRDWLLTGLWWTVALAAISAIVSLVLGVLLGTIRAARVPILGPAVTGYIEFFRNTPLLVQLFFWYFGFPAVLPETARAFLYQHNYEFTAGVLGLSLYSAAFMAEVVRAGIEAVPHGQTEAAMSTGLGRGQTLWHVILPQALRIVIPPMGNQLLNVTKNSSLAMTIAVAELTFQSQQIGSYTFRGFEATTAATAIYLVLSLIIAGTVLLLERWAALPGSGAAAGRTQV